MSKLKNLHNQSDNVRQVPLGHACTVVWHLTWLCFVLFMPFTLSFVRLFIKYKLKDAFKKYSTWFANKEGMGRKLKFKLKSGLIMPPTLLSTRHWTGTNILNKNISRPSRHIWVESKLFHWKCNVQDECLITCCWLDEGSTVYSVTHHTSRRHTCCRSRSQSRVLTQHTTLLSLSPPSVCLHHLHRWELLRVIACDSCDSFCLHHWDSCDC